MSVIVFNPTNETMGAQHIGEDIVLPPDSKVKMSDSRAKHVLNILGPRGLMTLEFGDENRIEEKRAQGVERNLAFKKRQVQRHNQQNEAQKRGGRPWLEPPAHIKAYADELGLELVEPYSERADERGMVQSLIAQNQQFQNQMAAMQTQMADLLKIVLAERSAPAIKSVPEPDEFEQEVNAVETEGKSLEQLEHEIIETAKGKNKRWLRPYLVQNIDLIVTFSQKVKDRINNIYQAMYGESFPDLMG